MSKDNIDDFLKNLGMKKQQEQQAQNGQWDKIIQPNSSYLIVGDVGTGKSALAYWLLETFSKKYDLLPTVVGFPRDKQPLLPPGFAIKDSPEELNTSENAIVFIDEADLQLPIEDTKARQYVVNFLSLPRHRHQIFLLAFHFPRLVLGRYLPFFGAFLLKRPPYLIEFASKNKNDALSEMMRRAEERFGEMPGEQDIMSHTYVVAPRIRWQGMLENPLCSFWTQQLSEVWAGVGIDKGGEYNKGMGHSPERKKIVAPWFPGPPTVPGAAGIQEHVDERGYLHGLTIIDPEQQMNASRVVIRQVIKARYGDKISDMVLDDMRIMYDEYSAEVIFPSRIPWTPQLGMEM